MEFEFGVCTDVGQKRTQNQDCSIIIPELGFFMLADGMGGHKGGEIASAMASQIVGDEIRAAFERGIRSSAELLSLGIEKANDAIFQRSQDDENLRGMGTTATAALYKDGVLTVGHVGDSRCYLIHPHGLWRLTKDHSFIEEKLRAGMIRRADIHKEEMKNVITRSVGFERKVDIETYQKKTDVGDIYLLCSDGLTTELNDAEIFNVVDAGIQRGLSLDDIAQSLINAANESGGKDNITVILFRVNPSIERTQP